MQKKLPLFEAEDREFNSSFLSISNSNSKILILGSMPGANSLEKKEYYGNSRNSFWKIMGNILNFDYNISYKEKTDLLLENNIALWDVIKSCTRNGSLDSNIKKSSIEMNDFNIFFKNTKIKYIYFNGALPEKEYIKKVLPTLLNEFKEITYSRLPSTSPAMATLNFEQKLEQWNIIKEGIKNV